MKSLTPILVAAEAARGRGEALTADILMLAHAEIETLRAAIEVMHPGFCVEEAILLFGNPTPKEPKP